MNDKRTSNRVVYSTRQQESPPPPRDEASPSPSLLQGGQARVQREKAHRAGRWVTVVYDLELPHRELERLCAQLKKACATGGTVKDGRLEIQGDHAQKVLVELSSLGVRAKRSGA